VKIKFTLTKYHSASPAFSSGTVIATVATTATFLFWILFCLPDGLGFVTTAVTEIAIATTSFSESASVFLSEDRYRRRLPTPKSYHRCHLSLRGRLYLAAGGSITATSSAQWFFVTVMVSAIGDDHVELTKIFHIFRHFLWWLCFSKGSSSVTCSASRICQSRCRLGKLVILELCTSNSDEEEDEKPSKED
ncbi:hypothetical protein PIB30_070483, partial [Stylosanthes scabra]|nr:hypothetical protein [Stylosanthes scabra]